MGFMIMPMTTKYGLALCRREGDYKMNPSDDLIVKLLANKENWKKLTLELANTKEYELDQIDKVILQKEKWN